MKLTGATILVSRGMKVLPAAPAAYPYRSACPKEELKMIHKLAVTSLLMVLFLVNTGAGQEKPGPSVEDAAKSLIGEWELTREKDGIRHVLQLEFKATENKKGVWMHTTYFVAKGKDEDLRSSHGGAVLLQEKEGKVFFNREGEPIYLQFKDGKLSLKGEYEWIAYKFNLTGGLEEAREERKEEVVAPVLVEQGPKINRKTNRGQTGGGQTGTFRVTPPEESVPSRCEGQFAKEVAPLAAANVKVRCSYHHLVGETGK